MYRSIVSRVATRRGAVVVRLHHHSASSSSSISSSTSSSIRSSSFVISSRPTSSPVVFSSSGALRRFGSRSLASAGSAQSRGHGATSPFPAIVGRGMTRGLTRSHVHNSQSVLHKRTMFIQVQDTPNPDSLKFYPEGEKVLETGTMDFANASSAQSSPLAKRIFQIEGVTGCFLTSDFVTVSKEEDLEWVIVKPQVFEMMTQFYSSGDKVLDAEYVPAKDTEILPDDDESVAMIKELLDTRIRPAVQEDGGDIEYLGFDDGVVLVKMKGSCSGCPSSSATLKGGIERMLMHWVPEVNAVVAVDDNDLEKINLDAFKKLEQTLVK
eukprot:TRINITY_DN1165_c0_g2_i1.p1 TRINITY_DN1165_c0_g2~~TRINITY_DN1165_c0_g2_i1.p1  ORF type:complete len:378 (+),score=53.75 TRINITY_DN1165_c0_g2_i1:165-1136(+)